MNVQIIPDGVWSAYTVIVVIGALFGFLSGFGLLSPLVLLVILLGAVAVFVPWAVCRLNPESLRNESVYRDNSTESG